MLLREVLTSTPGAERKVCRCRQAFLPTSAGTQLTGRNHTHLTADKSWKSFLWFSPVNQQRGLYPLEHLSPGVSHCKHSAANTAVLTACSLAEGQPCSHASFLPGSPAQLFPHRITPHKPAGGRGKVTCVLSTGGRSTRPQALLPQLKAGKRHHKQAQKRWLGPGTAYFLFSKPFSPRKTIYILPEFYTSR